MLFTFMYVSGLNSLEPLATKEGNPAWQHVLLVGALIAQTVQVILAKDDTECHLPNSCAEGADMKCLQARPATRPATYVSGLQALHVCM